MCRWGAEAQRVSFDLTTLSLHASSSCLLAPSLMQTASCRVESVEPVSVGWHCRDSAVRLCPVLNDKSEVPQSGVQLAQGGVPMWLKQTVSRPLDLPPPTVPGWFPCRAPKPPKLRSRWTDLSLYPEDTCLQEGEVSGLPPDSARLPRLLEFSEADMVPGVSVVECSPCT